MTSTNIKIILKVLFIINSIQNPIETHVHAAQRRVRTVLTMSSFEGGSMRRRIELLIIITTYRWNSHATILTVLNNDNHSRTSIMCYSILVLILSWSNVLRNMSSNSVPYLWHILNKSSRRISFDKFVKKLCKLRNHDSWWFMDLETFQFNSDLVKRRL
jgi:hypothetical protein